MIESHSEYINKVCSKCLNKENQEDLCNIVTTINGKPNCCNKCFKESKKASK